MKFLFIVICLVAFSSADKNGQFESFKKQFGKHYNNVTEEEFRQKIFLQNVQLITDHNKLYKEGKVSFDLAINPFADLTSQEFAEKYNGFHQLPHYKPKNVYTGTNESAPDSIDWRDYGYVTSVKDQGQCGSDWAFCVTECLEAQHFAVTGILVSLSVQQLMDCTVTYGNQGCNGGSTDAAYQYIIDNHGLASEASYPYTERLEKCKDDIPNAATASGYTDVKSGDETALTNACGNNGPISVAVDASHASFQLYNSGVYYEPACFENILDHCLLVVGYDSTEDGDDYYIAKNSWGIAWGEQGYIRMSRGRNNNCGIATQANWPQV